MVAVREVDHRFEHDRILRSVLGRGEVEHLFEPFDGPVVSSGPVVRHRQVDRAAERIDQAALGPGEPRPGPDVPPGVARDEVLERTGERGGPGHRAVDVALWVQCLMLPASLLIAGSERTFAGDPSAMQWP